MFPTVFDLGNECIGSGRYLKILALNQIFVWPLKIGGFIPIKEKSVIRWYNIGYDVKLVSGCPNEDYGPFPHSRVVKSICIMSSVQVIGLSTCRWYC